MQRLLGSSANRRLCWLKGGQRKFSYITAPVGATSDTKDCTRADGVSQLGGMRIEWRRKEPHANPDSGCGISSCRGSHHLGGTTRESAERPTNHRCAGLSKAGEAISREAAADQFLGDVVRALPRRISAAERAREGVWAKGIARGGRGFRPGWRFDSDAAFHRTLQTGVPELPEEDGQAGRRGGVQSSGAAGVARPVAGDISL